jgi:hypothetical protein
MIRAGYTLDVVTCVYELGAWLHGYDLLYVSLHVVQAIDSALTQIVTCCPIHVVWARALVGHAGSRPHLA